MAMLAEPKRKQKFSFDPRNTSWSNDETKFGHKLMEKMGWSKGKGLGAKEDGKTENISVTLKNDTRGVGCSKSHVDNWIAHQDDFNALLANLGQDHGTGAGTQEETGKKVLSLEQTSRSSKGRVHYQKFTKGKDLSLKSEQDLDCVFGKRKNQSGTNTPQTESGPNTPQTQSEPSSDSEENSHGLITVTSTDSVQDYFKKKMAEKLNKLKDNRTNTVQLENAWNNRNKIEASETDKGCDEIENENKKKSKKRKHDSNDTVDKNTEIANDRMDNSINQEEIKKNKKSKKKKKSEKECEIEKDNEVDVNEVNHIHVQNDKDMEEDKPTKKKSKKKKKSSEIIDSLDCDVIKTETSEESVELKSNEESIIEDKPKKKKKSKKRKREDIEDVEVKPVKLKKRVSFMLVEDDDGEDVEKDESKEKTDKNIVISETSELECNKKKELDRDEDENSGSFIKTSCSIKEEATFSTQKACSNPNNNIEIKPHNINEKGESDVKNASDVKDSGRRGLMSVKEVKKAGDAFRGSNISYVKGYSGMKITPMDVKNKLNKIKQL